MVESAQGISRQAFLEQYNVVGENGVRQLNSTVDVEETRNQYSNLSLVDGIPVGADLSAGTKAIINPEGKKPAQAFRHPLGDRRTVEFDERKTKSKPISATPHVRNQDGPVVQSNLLLLSGPGGTAFDKDKVNNLARNLATAGPSSVSSLGDGAASVTLDDVIAKLRELKRSGGPVTIFIQAHGKVDGEHCIKLGDGSWVPIRDFFNAVKNEFGDETPVTIFMTSCHGGSARRIAESLLPKNSVFVALAPGEQIVFGDDVDNLTNVLANTQADFDGDNWTESDELLMVYLAKALKTRISPELAVGGQGYRFLDSDLKKRVGQQFSPEERERIHKRLDGLIGRTATSGVIKMIESARDEWAIPAIHYGPALAAVLAVEYWQTGR